VYTYTYIMLSGLISEMVLSEYRDSIAKVKNLGLGLIGCV
jgi:hypothetical protein